MNPRASYASCALALGTVLFVSASPARACSYDTKGWALPTMESRVPANTRIWFYVEAYFRDESHTRESVMLKDAEGRVVPTQFERVLLGDTVFPRTLYVLTPLEPLLVGSEYQAGAEGLSYAHFVVTDGPDLKSPRKPKEVYRGEYAQGPNKNSCGAYAIVTMAYDLENPLEELMVVALDDHDSFDPDSLSGTLFEAASPTYEGSEGLAQVDYGTTPVSGWPASNPKIVRSRVGTFDLAGNFSGWSEPTTIALPSTSDDCAVTAPGLGGAGSSLMAIGMVLGLTFARWTRRTKY